MAEQPKKAVLIVDDEPAIAELLKDEFTDCTERQDCPYEFEVDIARSTAECVQKVRTKKYDVIVLDVRMEEETRGLDIARTLGLPISSAFAVEFSYESPVRIVFTGFPSYRQCVKALRYGAWDYIVKEDVGNTPMARIVVDSAMTRLRQFDLRRELEQRIAAAWLPQHLWELQPAYGGKLIAIWHKPEIRVIASGSDAFELEANLGEWRKLNAAWEQPFLVRIPPPPEENEAEG
jgi:CheY-like chemotaxis protein